VSTAGVDVLAWSVHLPTADQTCVRLALPPRGERDPWPFTLAVTALARAGARGDERFRALGAGRGDPLIASQQLTWRGCPLHLETVVLGSSGGAAEVALALPSWDEMTATAEATEDAFWDLVDAVAAAVSAVHGAIGDGEPLGPAPNGPAALARALALHPALLVDGPVVAEGAGWRAAHYRELPASGLHVLLR
jgi:hypothetical protein